MSYNPKMNEYFTEALVLDKKNLGDMDTLAYLYAKNLGKTIAKAKSSRKITSKLGGHLEPLNLIKARLVGRRALPGSGQTFQIVDAITLERPLVNQPLPIVVKFLSFFNFIKEMTFENQPDLPLWSAILKHLKNPTADEKTIYRSALKILGFDPEFTFCSKCKIKNVDFFLKEEQIFLCRKCVLTSKIKKDDIILI